MRTMRAFLAVMLVAGFTVGVRGEEDAKGPSPVGKKIADFRLQDFRGATHALSDFSDGKPTVVVFLGTECPLAKVYGPRLVELAAEFAPKGVHFLGIDSNQQDSITEMAAYARVAGIEFPFLRDQSNTVADQFGAERTPQVFVLDGKHVIRYSGRIDDQYGFQTGQGYAKPRLQRRDLAEALNEILDGKDVSQAETKVIGCLIGRMHKADPNAPVTYSNQIARILQKNCVECHRTGEIAPFTLTSYEDAAGWAEMMAEVVREQRMPPWHADPTHGQFLNDRTMSESDKQAIYDWVAHGAPEGDPKDLPEPRQFVDGWQIPTPDQIVYMSEKPVPIPATGALEYQYFLVDPGFKEDKWIKATESRPGDRSVVHHIFVFSKPPGVPDPDFTSGGGEDFNPGQGGVELISGTAPGNPPIIARPGMAAFVPAGSKLIFQMHYTPNGKATEDRSCVGFVFAKPEEVKMNAFMNMAINVNFRIPPGADNFPVESSHTFGKDSLLISMTPHMHLRGKAFRYDLEYPNGSVETVLNVPRYDFNWQVTYQLTDPKRVPAGTKLKCLAHFDNSEGNLANPDPTKEVRWGDQTWEEMMIGWFAETTDVDTGELPREEQRTFAFLKQLDSKPLKVSGLLEKAAGVALNDSQTFETFVRRLTRVVPQIDRVCVSVVENGKLRFVDISQAPVLALRVGDKNQEFNAAESQLARWARDGKTVVQPTLDGLSAAEFKRAAKVFRSSMHVPLSVDGKPATLNCWSLEPDAFPEVAVKTIEALVGRMQRSEQPVAAN